MRTRTQADDVAAGNPYCGQIEAAWEKIRPALERCDPNTARAEWGRAPENIRHALECRVENWIIKQLAIPPARQHPYEDRDGLVWLMWEILGWKELPLRPFSMSILPDIMAAMATHGHLRRERAMKDRESGGQAC